MHSIPATHAIHTCVCVETSIGVSFWSYLTLRNPGTLPCVASLDQFVKLTPHMETALHRLDMVRFWI